jgi:hypothetical protein
MSKFRKALKGVIGGSTIKPKPFTIILVVSSSIALSVLGEGVILSPAAARPVDGGFYSWYGMDDYFLVENGKYVPAYFRGAKRKLSEFDEISPWILMDKSSGTFYCSSSLRTNSGKAPSDSSGEKHICSKSGWKSK